MQNSFKIGDYIKCIKNCIMDEYDFRATTKNEYYKIISIKDNDYFEIKDNDYCLHKFNFYDEWFNIKPYIRKEKFKKIE